MAYVDLNKINKYNDNNLITKMVKKVNRLIDGYVDKTDTGYRWAEYTLRRGNSPVAFARMLKALRIELWTSKM